MNLFSQISPDILKYINPTSYSNLVYLCHEYITYNLHKDLVKETQPLVDSSVHISTQPKSLKKS